jgi:hypothetical protein
MLICVTGQHRLPELDAFLGGIPFFAALDEVTRHQLAEQLEPIHMLAGDVVIAEGEAGDSLCGGQRPSPGLGRGRRDRACSA